MQIIAIRDNIERSFNPTVEGMLTLIFQLMSITSSFVIDSHDVLQSEFGCGFNDIFNIINGKPFLSQDNFRVFAALNTFQHFIVHELSRPDRITEIQKSLKQSGVRHDVLRGCLVDVTIISSLEKK
jgi:hypothetical protein